ncbi:hypothetical protein JOB18_046779 [Solea senegalensis]|uniref:Sushi domain-containing protein n=1 Tax=Solea senegalensis TaxID=28829 RepID=A0AAV6SXU5_SOLSE|nr:membrane cofactor protein-like isoform X1 [Solea senegalensis]XP_043894230.1 membrane cofactor protein-like isoform X1 [Solea senegalensis]XP_043894231.1 membrane cofactor protein-like isoform X1 [Solea senegalensis]XP_043894232.1 membrane cofactor protein-like isoform X1 [Solea senegalensis]KAG7521368.1 hypothetical protein JOB18_046779 [Solea senegalensis]
MIAVCRTTVLVLLGLVVFAQSQNENCSKPVPGPNMNLKDSFILLETFPHGSKVSFACAVGYVTAGGSPSITCTSGTWSPVMLKCERFNCGSAGEILNGEVDYPEGTQFGDVLVASCNTGYNMIGRSRITCGARGWTDRLPECQVQACDPPPALANGDYTPKVDEVYFYGNVIRYSCNKGFVLDGSVTAVCSESGQFDPRDPPKCTFVGDVQCKDPGSLQNGERTAGFQPPHGYLSTVQFQCNSGYILNGSGIITCGLDGNWSPRPQCIKSTPTPTTTTTTTKATPPIVPSKETTVPSPDTTPPPDHANHLKWAIPTVLGIIIVAVICLVVYKKKRGSQRGYSDKNASKDEGVALSLKTLQTLVPVSTLAGSDFEACSL